MGKSPVKFIVVGAGNIGKRHLDLLLAHPEAEVCAVIDNDPLVRKTLSATCPVFSDLSAGLTACPQADVVNVCTPNGLHAEHAVNALRQGKHVLIEKPMALNDLQARTILSEADKAGKRVFCVLQNRFTPTARWFNKTIREGWPGKIYMIQVNCFWNRDERYYKKGSWRGTMELDGGTLFTQFSHFIDLVHWTFGDWYDVNAQLSNFGHKESTDFEDSGNIRFRTADDAMGSFSFTTATWKQNMESSMTVIGEKGSIKVGGQYMDRIDYCQVEGLKEPKLPPSNPPNQYGAIQGSAANHMHVFDNLIRALRGEAASVVEGREAAGVVRLIEEVYLQSRESIPEPVEARFSERK